MKNTEEKSADFFTISYERLPTFIGIGSQRCGSTWLDNVLRSHPQIVMAPKESSFFNLHIRTEGLEWYYKLFDESSAASIRGDITPTYAAMFPEKVAFVKQLIPHLKIVLIIRNPVDRLVSQITRQWTYSYTDKGALTTRNLFALLRQVDTSLSRRLTNYLTIYQIWTHFFDKNSILIEKYDTLAHNPQILISKVLTFLNADATYELLQDVSVKKYNQSKYKDEIPSMLKWYLAKEWLPSIKKLNEITDLDLNDWIYEMSDIASKSRFQWHLIRIFHKVYFVVPYNFAYLFANLVRRKFRLIQLRKYLKFNNS
ncbi:sulfotransferase family protein [Gloeocapsopsis dulcis]|uniref:Sulfotransferase domain-containing protein n=1 Tax=Gloeocapsopsis dulcis AAB1 = 1H9 TaxID=1433147 RepID=A0A6N8FX11_9CHRO|nr:sulfotransferase [Gloeocapsopsis dulcis]MUL37294.1 hypothetical protein [Gloeocapsopsis dulcis AAB1 = 1H9]WNN91098.1 sulfotransferase [Gloeocapsopsis dulcis]